MFLGIKVNYKPLNVEKVMLIYDTMKYLYPALMLSAKRKIKLR